jgi:hypothetical protein
VVLAAGSVPASAVIFGKKAPPKPDPKDRVSALIVTLKTDKDESKRAEAAEELRQYDPKAFADIVPVLIDVLINDPKPAVRTSAAQSLGKLRPVSLEVGWALEQALAKDPSMRVRLQARTSLLQYHWAGYKSPGKDGPVIESKEPPLAPADREPTINPIPAPPPRIMPSPATPPKGKPVPPPPPVSSAPPSVRPLPSRPSLTPAEPPLLQPAPPSTPRSEGPELGLP